MNEAQREAAMHELDNAHEDLCNAQDELATAESDLDAAGQRVGECMARIRKLESKFPEVRYWTGASGRFYPSTEWNDAMEAAEKVGLFHPSLGCGKLEQSMGEDGTEWCMSWFENGKEIEVYAESGPVAICKAILASRKGELNG